jgi:hypothetical protein
MSIIAAFITATFTIPENISVTPQSMLWLLPLVASISIVYKATKMPKIKAAEFTKEVVILFGSIIVFMAVTAAALCILSWLIIE